MMRNALSKTALTRTLPKLRAQMGKAAGLLDQLLAAVDAAGRVNLASALEMLYPEAGPARAQANLRQFRLEVEKAAQRASVAIWLASDKKTRTPLAERWLWFEGEDPLNEATEQWVKPNLAGPKRLPQDAVLLGPKRLYVVYSDADADDARKLIDLLTPLGKTLEFELWHHGMILPGEDPQQERRKRRQHCDLTLHLLSPHFEAEGLAAERTARRMPVLLHKIPKPPEDAEVFQHKDKCFSDSPKPRDFALSLVEKIRAVLDKKAPEPDDFFQALSEHGVKFVRGSAASISLRQEILSNEPASNRCDALQFLNEWLADDKAPRYCALFGELGMGKTTTAKEFARQLWERRTNGESVPAAIFLDLRFVGDFAAKDPDLDEILTRILRRDWKGGARGPAIESQDIYQTVEQGGLVIFDGLDEVLVHLTPNQGQLFTRQLFRLVPPDSKNGRLLITCRTHYFRTFKEQASHFRLEDRDEVSGESYRALLLLPFEAQQIRTYLENSLAAPEAEKAYEFISTVHNLPELAQRPYTLNLITRQLAKLEEWKAAGKPVTGLTLYRFVVEEWLLRDQGKHQLTPDHKQMLMEQIAAALVRSGARSWRAADLEQWLIDFLEANPRVAAHYHGKNRELLKEDLRTATFLVRDEESGQFRFAHSSLQEYFLAYYLRRALEEKRLGDWALKGISPETLDFLGQSLREQPSAAGLQGLTALRDAYHADASELAFQYVLLAKAKDFPAPEAAGFQLPDADLFGLEVDHAGLALLDLSNSNFEGARLANTFWRNCKFTKANFADADAARAEWHGCELRATEWRGAKLEGGLFRRCQLTNVSFAEAHRKRTRWLSCDGISFNQESDGVGIKKLQLGHTNSVNGCAWSVDSGRVVSASEDNSLKIWDAVSGECLSTLSGHAGCVNGCAWAPDGQRIVSASDDCTLKIWDAASGECLRTLSGHTGSVNACAWSADGQRVVSASSDKSLKIWNAASGEFLRTLSGYSMSVNSCAWLADSQRVVSAFRDGSLKIWDAATGACLRTLSGHTGPVNGCAWSADSQRVVSASADNSLKIWDAASGECLRTLRGHTGPVYDCAWSADSEQVVSASDDGSLKIWDAASGECLGTLSGHMRSVYGCAWSADSQRVVSASDDNSLKIWDAASGECLGTLIGFTSDVSACVWSADSRLVVSAPDDYTVKIWDAASGECLRTLSGHTESATGCAWSADGQRVVSSSDDATLKIWDAESGECLLTLSGHTDSVNGCAWSADSQRVVSASLDQSLKIWDAESGECLLTLSGHTDSVDGCAWSADSRRVVSASGDISLKIWDAASGECLRTLRGHASSVRGCAWSADSRWVASASDDNNLKIWDARSGEYLRTLKGHTDFVLGCAWSADSHRVVSVSFDKSVKIWDAASGKCLRSTLTQQTPRGCHWSAKDNRIVACFDDGSLRFYSGDTLSESGLRCYHLHAPHCEPSWATVDPASNAVISYGEDAWRSIGFVVPDEKGLPVWRYVEEGSYKPTG